MSWEPEIEKLFNITEGEVFEKATLDSLFKLMDSGYIDSFEFPISTGKEGNVFRAICKNKFIAVKIYRINTVTFRNISKYLMYEPPRNVKKNKRSIIFTWALKEFNNLKKLYEAGIRVPKPIAREGNVIVMEYIGTAKKPAPLLKDAEIKDAEKIFKKIEEYMEKMYKKVGLVHADLSEYNILVYRGSPVIIDVGQTVSKDNPMALEFLKRDVKNITKFFSRFMSIDENEILNRILEG